ncbi:MAG: DUF4013 domain-containing protein, partial [Anaerolineae bacterium]|nr:DUF4013 domain-containing protein [Anaerolineae bacterium]
LIPFIGLGYMVGVARNVMRDRPNPLPGTDELGRVVADGLAALVAAILYFLPLIVVACVMFAPGMLVGDNELGILMFCLACSCVFIAALAYTIPAIALYWAGIIRYARTGQFNVFTAPGSRWRDVQAHTGVLLILLVYVLALVTLALVAAVVLWITCLGLPLLGFWVLIATGHLIGQAGTSMAFGESD